MSDRLKVGDTVLINSDIPQYGGLIGVISAVGCGECLVKFNGGENNLTSKVLLNTKFTKLSRSIVDVELSNEFGLKVGDTVLVDSSITYYGGLIGTVENIDCDNPHLPIEVNLSIDGGKVAFFAESELTKLSTPITTVEKFGKAKSEVISTKTKSDGGSSDYYFTKLPKEMIDQIVKTGGIEIKDIVSWVFYNDANIKDIVKALKRIKESENGGGKEGTTIEYDLNKINFYVEEFKKYMLIKMKQDGTETTHD